MCYYDELGHLDGVIHIVHRILILLCPVLLVEFRRMLLLDLVDLSRHCTRTTSAPSHDRGDSRGTTTTGHTGAGTSATRVRRSAEFLHSCGRLPYRDRRVLQHLAPVSAIVALDSSMGFSMSSCVWAGSARCATRAAVVRECDGKATGLPIFLRARRTGAQRSRRA